jgi:hypothetical protein
LLSGFISIYIFDSFYLYNYEEIDSYYTYIAISAFIFSVFGSNIRKILNPHLIKYNFSSLTLIFIIVFSIFLSLIMLYSSFDRLVVLLFSEITLIPEFIYFFLYLAIFLLNQIFRSVLEVSRKYELAEMITISGSLLYIWFLITLPKPEIELIFKLLLLKTLFEGLLLVAFSYIRLKALRHGVYRKGVTDYRNLTLGNIYYKSEGLLDRYLVQGTDGFISSMSLSGTLIASVQTFYMKTRVVPLISRFSNDVKSGKTNEIIHILKAEAKVINLLVAMGSALFIGYVYFRNYDSSVTVIFLCNLLFFKYSLSGSISSALLNCIQENKKQVIFGIISFTIFIPFKVFASVYSDFLIPVCTGFFFLVNYYYHLILLKRV